MRWTNFGLTAVAIACLAPVLAGCDEPRSAVAATPVVPEVSVITIKPQARSIVRELPGRIAPTRVADVRPRVSGIISKRLFQQGSEVKAGDPLYQIDPRPFEVEVAGLRGGARQGQGAARAGEPAGRAHLDAGDPAGGVAGAERDRDQQHAAGRGRSRGARGRGRPRQAQSRYATIRAPISGAIGAALVSEGALVVQNDADAASPPSSSSTRLCRLHPVGRRTEPAAPRRSDPANSTRSRPMRCASGWCSTTARSIRCDGKLLFSDAKVDAYTGQVTLRGEFKNPDAANCCRACMSGC